MIARSAAAAFALLAAWLLPGMARGAATPLVRVTSESPNRIALEWEAGATAARLAVPAGASVRIASLRDTAGRSLPEGSVGVTTGLFRRLGVATLTLDRASLPAEAVPPFHVAIAVDPGADASAGMRGADVDAEAEFARVLRLANPSSVRRILEQSEGAGRAAARAKSLGDERIAIAIDREGLYRITHEQLAAAGADLTGRRSSDLRVTSRGLAATAREITVTVLDADADGMFEPGDAVELWGEALTGESVPDYFQRADFSDTNAYVLDFVPGARLRMAEAVATPVPSSPVPQAFLDTARWESDDVFLANHRTGLQGVDHFYSCPSLDSAATSSRTVAIPLPGLLPSSSLGATLRARLLSRTQAGSEPSHVSDLRIDGTPASHAEGGAAELIDHARAALPASILSDPATVEVLLAALPSGERQRSELDWISLEYPRSFTAVSGRLTFTATAPARVTVTGVGPGAVAHDVTDPARPVILTGLGRGASTVEIEVPDPGVRRIAVSTPGAGEPAPATIRRVVDTGLADPSNRADLLIIGPAAWTTPPTEALQRYVAWRQAQGLVVRVASVESAMDEMHDGIFSPAGIGRLVSTAVTAWELPPRFVLLLGDASVDYKDLLRGRSLRPSDCSPAPDPCGHAETAWAQAVPTHVVDAPEDQEYLGYFASDSLFAMASGGDWMPDVALGRMPARDAAGLGAMLDKILSYEALRDAPPAWARRFMTVGDEVVPGQEIIEASQDAAAAGVPSCYERTTMFFQRDWNATDAPGFTAELLGTWADPARGAAVMSYVGHGNTFSWSAHGLLTNAGSSCRNDVEALAVPGAPAPILLNADCVAGGFMHPASPSLLEELVRAPEGGAIAAFGPTGITDLAFAEPILGSFFDALYGPHGRGERLGDVILAVQASLALAAEAGSPDELLTNVLLGDPSLRVVVPFAPPARGLRAEIAGDDVRLEWDAVPGATAYRLFRSEAGASGPWTVAADAVAGTSFDERDLVNAREYHWAIEPLQGCLPGRWSEAVAATPCDPAQAPEAPGIPRVLDTDCDGGMLVSWDPSPAPGVAGYVVRATRQGSAVPELETSVTGTFTRVEGLVPFRDYVLDVIAVDGCGIRGAASLPSSVRITCPLGIDAPAFIDDLRVRRSGADLVLEWGAVTTTIQGAPLAPAGYRVHRAVRPDFDAAASLVETVPMTSAIQAGRVGNGSPLEMFAVSAVDSAGTSGGVGHDLPQGIRGLFRSDAGADYELTWTPVRHDLRGEITPIARYEVHASSSPLSRAAVDGLVPAAIVTEPRALLPQALGAYHLVVAVDVHGNRSAW